MNWEKLLNGSRLRESERQADARNDFESDFGRIIFSSATRRMHDKTQVFPLSSDDNTHTRLTHSMEVMAIGHSLGIKICEHERFAEIANHLKRDLFREIPVILKNACLIHDIGNPPFGHFGETVIQSFFKQYFEDETSLKLTATEKEDFLLFDGNAQGFRVITKLQILHDIYGLNLTCGTLAAYLKYPNSGQIDKKSDNISKKKRGVFQSEKDYLQKIGEACDIIIDGAFMRHPLCYLMEAADSICYLVMDIEDGFNKGWYTFDKVLDYFIKIEGIKDGTKRIVEKTYTHGAEVSKMVAFRIHLIGRLVQLATDNFFANFDAIMRGKYKRELIADDPTGLAKKLAEFCFSEIFPNTEITSLELTGHSVLTGLLSYYTNFVFHRDEKYRSRAQSQISNSVLRCAFLENGLPEKSSIDDLSDYYKLRVIVDYISGMTDQYALNQFQKLSGQKIN